MKKIALFALALPLVAQDWSPASPGADQIKFAKQIKLVQEHESMGQRARHCEVESATKAKPLAKDPRTAKQKKADRLLLKRYFRLKPTGKLVRVEFPDGMVLYVPGVK